MGLVIAVALVALVPLIMLAMSAVSWYRQRWPSPEPPVVRLKGWQYYDSSADEEEEFDDGFAYRRFADLEEMESSYCTSARVVLCGRPCGFLRPSSASGSSFTGGRG
jgi:hypothetical protein